MSGYARSARYILAFVSLALGLLMTGDGLYIWTKAAFGQILLEKSWHTRQPGKAPDKPWSWADMRAIAKMDVPSLGKQVMVLSNTSGEALAWGPGHIPGTPLPGNPGLSIIAGHRDTHFAILGNIQPGDVIKIDRFDGRRHSFKVRQHHIVDANHAGLDMHPQSPTLALVTCWPLDALQVGGDERLVILADLVDHPDD